MTFIDTLIGVVLTGVLVAALGTSAVVMMTSSPTVQRDVAEAHDLEQLVRYLPADVASTRPLASRFSTDPVVTTGCSGAGADAGVNVLHLTTADVVSGQARSLNYRLLAEGTEPARLVRLECSGADASSLGAAERTTIASELDPAGPPVVVDVVANGTAVERVVMTIVGTSGRTRSVAGTPLAGGTGLPPASTTTTTTTTTTTVATTTTAPATTTSTSSTTTSSSTTTTSTTTTTAVPACALNPFRYTAGFEAFVGGNVRLASGDSYGPVLAGGNLSFGNYLVTPRSTTNGFKASGESVVTGLLVGGSVDWTTSSGMLTVNSTPVHIANFSNGVKGASNSNETVLLKAPGSNTSTSIKVAGINQPVSGTLAVQRSGLIDTSAALSSLRTQSQSLATLPGSCNGAVTLVTKGQNGVGAWSGSGALWLEYQANKVNVFNTSVAQLNSITNVNKTGASAPASTTTLLLINVNDGGAISFTPPIWTQNEPRSVIWNFPNATSVTINGPLWGSMLAPRAAVTLNADMRGNVIAASLTVNGGSLDWDRRFAGVFPWDNWTPP